MSIEDLTAKIKSMPAGELNEYRNSIVFVSRFSNVAGVSSLFLAIAFTNVFTVCSALLAVYVLGRISVNASTVIRAIDAKMQYDK